MTRNASLANLSSDEKPDGAFYLFVHFSVFLFLLCLRFRFSFDAVLDLTAELFPNGRGKNG